MSTEMVNHPRHYGGEDNPYEAIKVIEAWSPNLPKGTEFHIGNTLKYLSRSGKKGSALEDLRKARWYLDRAIQQIEQTSKARPDEAPNPPAADGGMWWVKCNNSWQALSNMPDDLLSSELDLLLADPPCSNDLDIESTARWVAAFRAEQRRRRASK
jgi:hypothetical protein